jgi:hypothetical protein
VLRLFLHPSQSGLGSLDDIIMWIAVSIFHICLPDVAKGYFSDFRLLYIVFSLLLGEMLDVVRYGLYGGKLGLLGQTRYI